MSAFAVTAAAGSADTSDLLLSEAGGNPTALPVKREVVLLRSIGIVIALFMIGMLALMCCAEARIARTEGSFRSSTTDGPSMQVSSPTQAL